MTTKEYIIVDVDGTIFNCDHRQEFAQTGQWEEFHARSASDEPYPDIVDLLGIFDRAGKQIIALTGRNERFRLQTDTAFLKYGIWVDELLMRDDGDFSRDIEFKIAALEKFFGDKEAVLANVLLVIDDRDRVVTGLRAYGLTVLQPREGAY
jgi:phosphoglycolate phosphatase-like HAD superfamily hydrolase